ncbi:hypothetical protein [Moraxella boevrei]|uniref:hypothetical protein n=1 Tax=Faucicola boevrei TaxID=346665 RepID=UPI003734F70A
MKQIKKTAVVALLSTVFLGLTACTTTTGVGSQPGSARATGQGAVLGGVIGALAKSDGDRKDIGKAAAIGAAVGAGAGYGLSTTQSYPYQK